MGNGFWYQEVQLSLKILANRLFKCQWEIDDENRGWQKCDDDSFEKGDNTNDSFYDNDTLPTLKTIRDLMRYYLKLTADALIKTKNQNCVITRATDSTTR